MLTVYASSSLNTVPGSINALRHRQAKTQLQKLLGLHYAEIDDVYGKYNGVLEHSLRFNINNTQLPIVVRYFLGNLEQASILVENAHHEVWFISDMREGINTAPVGEMVSLPWGMQPHGDYTFDGANYYQIKFND